MRDDAAQRSPDSFAMQLSTWFNDWGVRSVGCALDLAVRSLPR